MKTLRAMKWLNERGAAAVMAAANEQEARRIMHESEVELWNGVRLALSEHETRLSEHDERHVGHDRRFAKLERWKKRISKRFRGRPPNK